jgi:hypothetical protein
VRKAALEERNLRRGKHQAHDDSEHDIKLTDQKRHPCHCAACRSGYGYRVERNDNGEGECVQEVETESGEWLPADEARRANQGTDRASTIFDHHPDLCVVEPDIDGNNQRAKDQVKPDAVEKRSSLDRQITRQSLIPSVEHERVQPDEQRRIKDRRDSAKSEESKKEDPARGEEAIRPRGAIARKTVEHTTHQEQPDHGIEGNDGRNRWLDCRGVGNRIQVTHHRSETERCRDERLS